MSEYKKKMDVKYAELYVTAIMVDERNKGYGQTPDAIETLLAALDEAMKRVKDWDLPIDHQVVIDEAIRYISNPLPDFDCAMRE